MTDRIVSHPATQEFRDNYDRIFGKRTLDCDGVNGCEASTTVFVPYVSQDAHSELRLNDQDTGIHT